MGCLADGLDASQSCVLDYSMSIALTEVSHLSAFSASLRPSRPSSQEAPLPPSRLLESAGSQARSGSGFFDCWKPPRAFSADPPERSAVLADLPERAAPELPGRGSCGLLADLLKLERESQKSQLGEPTTSSEILKLEPESPKSQFCAEPTSVSVPPSADVDSELPATIATAMVASADVGSPGALCEGAGGSACGGGRRGRRRSASRSGELPRPRTGRGLQSRSGSRDRRPCAGEVELNSARGSSFGGASTLAGTSRSVLSSSLGAFSIGSIPVTREPNSCGPSPSWTPRRSQQRAGEEDGDMDLLDQFVHQGGFKFRDATPVSTPGFSKTTGFSPRDQRSGFGASTCQSVRASPRRACSLTPKQFERERPATASSEMSGVGEAPCAAMRWTTDSFVRSSRSTPRQGSTPLGRRSSALLGVGRSLCSTPT
eukprot:TRINITY_DN38735_c0_g1_i1.p1 TRINITY_DN38735_c0_g1~~TRINITY_DN38735_c0_g1_i1.p1  ORF type:complete len:430 (-),score=46.71 TRINITY_DN38735_c0_g1_i1:167-1456(-)